MRRAVPQSGGGGGVQMNCSPGKLRALAGVSECQNRPSGETSHSNWWLCIRQMHFYRVIHLPTSFLPLFLAAMFPHYHYSLLPHHLSLTPFSFILLFYASTSSSSPPLSASCALNICQTKNSKQLKKMRIMFSFVDSSKTAPQLYTIYIKTPCLCLFTCLTWLFPQLTRERPFERQGADRGNGRIVLVFITQQYSCWG